MTKSDFKIGQTVYMIDMSFNLQQMFSNVITATITKVGNKYVEIDKSSAPFRIDNGEEYIKDYSPSKKIYLSMDEIVELKKCYDLSLEIRNSITYGGRSIRGLNSHQLQDILNILKGGMNDG